MGEASSGIRHALGSRGWDQHTLVAVALLVHHAILNNDILRGDLSWSKLILPAIDPSWPAAPRVWLKSHKIWADTFRPLDPEDAYACTNLEGDGIGLGTDAKEIDSLLGLSTELLHLTHRVSQLSLLAVPNISILEEIDVIKQHTSDTESPALREIVIKTALGRRLGVRLYCLLRYHRSAVTQVKCRDILMVY